METKVCSICGKEKELTAFYPKMGRCKSCHNEKAKAWAKANREKARAIHAKWRAKPGSREKERAATKRWQKEHPVEAATIRRRQQVKQYGLTLEQFDAMVTSQDGGCAICGEVPNRRLDVDHNHETGQIRKLLCSRHNTLIGLCKESIEDLKLVIAYLKKHNLGNG